MNERSVVFAQDEVQATLDGCKTQFRREMAVQPLLYTGRKYIVPDDAPKSWRDCDNILSLCPSGQPGQPLWVRETWGDAGPMYGEEHDTPQHVGYFADKTALVFPWGVPHPEPGVPIPDYDRKTWNWAHIRRRSATTLPRWAARLFLEVVSVQVQQLKDITDDQARAEGLCQTEDGLWLPGPNAHPSWAFRSRWDRLRGIPHEQAWQANPWLWAVEFKVVDVLTRPKPKKRRVA
jgi:hypothetical protein